MTENEKRIELLILKYARHEPLTAEENAILKEWRSRSAGHDALPEKFRDEEWVRQNLSRLNRIPSAQIWERISEQVKKEKRLITPWYIKVAGIAAAIALVVVAIRALTPGGSPVRDEEARIGPLFDKTFDKTVSNGAGHSGPLSQVLPDGSKVLLNNGSTISYSSVFAGGKREVRLSGEAFFEIAKDPKRPFSVETEFGTTLDKSTEFDVRAYPDDPTGKVTVLEGAVMVNNGKEEKMLDQPLQQVQMTKDLLSKPVLLKNSDEVMAWRSGMLHLAGADLKTAMRELAHRYGKQVVYTGDLRGETVFDVRGETVFMDLTRDASWDEALEQLKVMEAKYASFSEKGDTVRISAPRTTR